MTGKEITVISKLVLALVFVLTDSAYADPITGYIGGNSSCPDTSETTLGANWGEAEITASLWMHPGHGAADRPNWDADPLNITMVREAGGHSLSFVNGDTFEVLGRITPDHSFDTAPVFNPDGRYTFGLSCDGWVQKIDIWSLKTVGQVRVGEAAHFLTLSADGKWLAVASTLPAALVILSTKDLSLAALHEVVEDGVSSRISALHPNPNRESFVLALQDVPEIWEVFHGPNPPDIGFSHDWRNEGIAVPPEPFPIRKIAMPGLVGGFVFDPSFEYALASSTDGGPGMVVDLVIGENVPLVDLPDFPVFGSGISWQRGNVPVLAANPKAGGPLYLVNLKTWNVPRRIHLNGPGQFVSSHDGSPYLWVGVNSGPNTGEVHLVHKQTLAIVKILQPASGAMVAHISFNKDGNHAYVSLGEEDGTILVYDSVTLNEAIRLPMKMPIGSYNIANSTLAPTGSER